MYYNMLCYSSRQKWCISGLASLNPKYTTSASPF